MLVMVVWHNIAPRPLFHIIAICFESTTGQRHSAVFIIVERAMTILELQSVGWSTERGVLTVY